jgi:hypothetical protein
MVPLLLTMKSIRVMVEFSPAVITFPYKPLIGELQLETLPGAKALMTDVVALAGLIEKEKGVSPAKIKVVSKKIEVSLKPLKLFLFT